MNVGEGFIKDRLVAGDRQVDRCFRRETVTAANSSSRLRIVSCRQASSFVGSASSPVGTALTDVMLAKVKCGDKFVVVWEGPHRWLVFEDMSVSVWRVFGGKLWRRMWSKLHSILSQPSTNRAECFRSVFRSQRNSSRPPADLQPTSRLITEFEGPPTYAEQRVFRCRKLDPKVERQNRHSGGGGLRGPSRADFNRGVLKRTGGGSTLCPVGSASSSVGSASSLVGTALTNVMLANFMVGWCSGMRQLVFGAFTGVQFGDKCAPNYTAFHPNPLPTVPNASGACADHRETAADHQPTSSRPSGSLRNSKAPQPEQNRFPTQPYNFRQRGCL
ncbi:hypothetical protein Bbelb_203410 [Branchiostoma belcheri]|nr:hypothetical protein Bbelb_203410 [Branchiostoma belcheri]